MTYALWGQGSTQYPFLGTTAENLHFFRPRQTTVNSSGMLGVALTDASTYVAGGVNTVVYQAVAYDQLGNVEVFESPTEDAVNVVQTDFVYFQSVQFASNPTLMSTAREAGFVWVEMNGSNYEIHYRTATYTPWNIEWTFNAASGTTPAPEPIVLTGVEQTLLSGIQDITEVQQTQHVGDLPTDNRDMLVAWETANIDGTTNDVSAHHFLSTGVGGGSDILLFDDLLLDRSWVISNARTGADFSVANEARNGSNTTIALRSLTAAGVTANLFTYNPGSAAALTDLSGLQFRNVGATNTAIIYLAQTTIGGNPAVVVRADLVDGSGVAVPGSTNEFSTSFADLTTASANIVLSGGFSGGTRVALAYQDSANHWTVQVLDATTYAVVDTFGGSGIFDRIAPSRTNVDRLTVFTRDSFSNAANALDYAIYDTRIAGGTFTGTAGSDVMSGSAFDDIMTGGDDNDKLGGGAGADNIDGGNGRDMLDGWAGNDTITGGSGNDVIDGGAGIDSMTGGTDNDTYYVDNVGDVIVEAVGEGTQDSITTYLNSYSIAGLAGIENLRFDGVGNFVGTGNGSDNVIEGLDGTNTLAGGGGNDTLVGGESGDVLQGDAGADVMFGNGGADIYYVDNVGDQTNDSGAPDIDTVFFTSVAGATLAANIEYGYSLGSTSSLTGNNLDNVLIGGYATVAQTLIGNDGNDFLSGTAVADVLNGGNGFDTLLGRGGGDQLIGGADSDNYYVEALSDIVTEAAGAAAGTNDIIYTNVNYTMSANVETLFTYGAASNVTGTNDANAMLGVYSTIGVTLNGLAGDDVLYGSGRADTLNGGADSDTMFGSAGGPDGFADQMNGGTGNDLYFVQEASDAVFENFNEGTDSVYAAINYTLGTDLETLFIYGSATMGTGNSAANTLIGSYINSGVTLNGAGGIDVIIGGGGDDTVIGGVAGDMLTGAAGNDLFSFAAGEANGDVITDFAGNGGGAGDSLSFSGYGAGATFTQIGATNQWLLTYNGGANTETLTFSNSASIHATDYVFV